MPSVVSNQLLDIDETTKLLVIASKHIGQVEIIIDADMAVFVLSHPWCWDAQHHKAYSFVNGKKLYLHKHLAEMMHRDRAVGYVSVAEQKQNDYRKQNLFIRFV